jgi:polyhydroxyalkanoate synthesis repressor PhaR
MTMDGVLMVYFLSSATGWSALEPSPAHERREPGGSPKIKTGKAEGESQTGYPVPLKFHGSGVQHENPCCAALLAASHNSIVRARLFADTRQDKKEKQEHGDEETLMAKNDGQIVIKKYANRRLYNTGTSTYVTLDDLAVMVKKGEDFNVQDAKSGDDITHSVLTQIIFEQESKTGNTLLPISFLRQLISYYGDQMQMVVPSYLEHSMQAFTEQHSAMREQINKTLGDTPLGKNLQVPMALIEETTRRNTELFQQAMKMFTPFANAAPAKETRKAEPKDLDELKEQLRALQTKLDNLS